MDLLRFIDRQALDNCDMSDVRCLIDHDSQKILGRTTMKYCCHR
ncbi:HK97 family phage prohead protease [Clostridium sp. Marseille-Q7071]